MGYATVNDLINDCASFYNDTNALDYVLPESTKRRILHYLQRTVDEVWYYRPWNFKLFSCALSAGSGEAALPYNFATVGPKGGLFENSTKQLWSEVDYQEWMTLRNSPGSAKQEKVFCIGNNSDGQTSNIGDGAPVTTQRRLLFPDPLEARAFTLYYEATPPRAGWDAGLSAIDYNQPLPLTEGFHNVLLLGTIAKLQEGKGDPRPQYRAEFIASLATAAAQHLPLTSKLQQLPRALPGGRW